MKINYNSYVAFPQTSKYLHKVYTQDILDKWGSQLAFLYQNGFTPADNSPKSIDEQMQLFNGFETYEDFEDFRLTFGKAIDFNEPTEIGYKIVDSVLDMVINGSAFARTDFINIREMGNLYKGKIHTQLEYLDMILNSADLEVVRVVKSLVEQKTLELLDECLDLWEDEHYNILLVKYQELYKQVFDIHKKINRALLNTSEKGKVAVMGNLNDELYGSAGGYNPNNSDIICRNGSAVFELKTLNDKTKSDEELRFKMLVIAKECVENGETDKTIVAFTKGEKTDLAVIRKILTDIAFSGIMILLELKYGLTLFEGDTLNSKRAKCIVQELTDICKYTGYNSKELM